MMWMLIALILLIFLFHGGHSFYGRSSTLFQRTRVFPFIYNDINTWTDSYSSYRLYDHKGKNDVPEEFAEWEAEEMELDKQAQVNIVDDDDSSIPDYMKKMLFKFEDKAEIIKACPEKELPTIAIIGRPNTGKSTIVNKLTNSYIDGAIVHDEAGVTRDCTYRTGSWGTYNFQVVDTGGIIFDDSEDIFADRITEQAILALGSAQFAVLVVDGKEGCTPLDEFLVDWLRKNCKVPLYLAVNKCESEAVGLAQANDFWHLGVGTPYPVSGIHGTGLADLLDDLVVNMEKVTNVIRENVTNIAFIGRPNVGKSSLFNKLLNQNRSIVSDVAGTTRDAIDEVLQRRGTRYRIIDTAGIRRKGRVEYGSEFFMVNRAFKAVQRAECVVLLLDATAGIVDQDRILAQRIADEGKSCVIALNKWDLVPNKDDKTYLQAEENIRLSLPVLRWAEIVLISALSGQRTEKLFDCVDRSAKQYNRRIPTAIINEVVNDATLWMAPPTVGSKSGRIYYCLQISTCPPTIVFFVNDPSLFTDNYQRYLERKIRDSLNLEGTPIKMIWRGKSLRDVTRASSSGLIDGMVPKGFTGVGNGGRTMPSASTPKIGRAGRKPR